LAVKFAYTLTTARTSLNDFVSILFRQEKFGSAFMVALQARRSFEPSAPPEKLGFILHPAEMQQMS
jgi:hypothetical protein